MNLRCLLLLAALLIAAVPAHAQQPVAAGRIKQVSGAAFVVRDGRSTPARAGDLVYEADSLSTGPDGRLGVSLRDDTRISLGPASEVHLSRFVYLPADGQLGFVLRFVRGLATYVSGRIAKLSPGSVRLETPSAIVGVRGTRLAIRVGAP